MEIGRKTLRRIFLGVVGCILLIWLLNQTHRVKVVIDFISGIIAPFVIGAAIAFVLNVPMRGFERLLKFIKKPGLRRVIALLLTFSMIILVIYAALQLLIPQLVDTISTIVERLPAFFNDLYEKGKDFLADNPVITEWIQNNSNLENLDWAGIVQKVGGFLANGLFTIVGGTFAAIGGVSSFLFDTVIALVFAIYCLFRKEILARQVKRLMYAFLPERICDKIVRVMRLTNSTFSNFISGQCLEACILGSMFAVAMFIFRMPYIPLVSILVAITALIPIVGAFVGCILGAFFILVDNPMQAVWFVIMFLVIQQIEGNVVYPRVVGKSVGLPGMWVLLAVTVGGDLMGIAGMMLMIPVFSVAYTLLREITTKRIAARGIERSKLQNQPPELSSRFIKKNKPKDKNQEPVSTDSPEPTEPDGQA